MSDSVALLDASPAPPFHVLEPPVPGVAARIADPVLFQQLLDDADELSQRALAAAADAVGGHARRPVLVAGEHAADEPS